MDVSQKTYNYAALCRYGFWGTLIASLLALAILLYQYNHHQETVYSHAKQQLQELTKDAAGEIDLILNTAMKEAEALAKAVSSKKPNDQALRKKLHTVILDNHFIYGGSITFKPFAFNKNRQLYSAYYSRNGKRDTLNFQYLEKNYNYTEAGNEWYTEALNKGSFWGEPYWDKAGKTYMITYSTPFYKENSSETNGVVSVDISMATIRGIIESLNIGPSGFGALTTRDGNYLYHPNYDYVLAHKSILDIAREKNDPDRVKIAEDAANLQGGIIDHVSTTTGKDSWFIYETVDTSGWSLQNTFIKSDIDVDMDYLRHKLILIMLAVMLIILSSAALLLKLEQLNVRRTWLYTVVISITLATGVAITWHLALDYHTHNNQQSIKVADKNTLQTIIKNHRELNLKKGLTPPLFIPTGLQIDALKFQGANDIAISGHVWQKYPLDFPEDLKQGVQFAHSKGVRFEEIDRQKQEDFEVIHWRFQADIRVYLDYSRYPLEVEQVAIQITPKESDSNVLLVPDLDAYKLLTPTLRPGMDQDVLLPGWKITETMFSFRKSTAMTNFGLQGNFDQQKFPELHYEIDLKRIFIDAFISNLTPLIVVLIVLFAINLIPGSIDVGRVLGVCVAVFFVVVFSHLDIRKHISSGEIFYLEYFFFITYLAIILVPTNAIRMAMNKNIPIFDYKDGIIAKSIYWPSILSIFFIITLIKFY